MSRGLVLALLLSSPALSGPLVRPSVSAPAPLPRVLLPVSFGLSPLQMRASFDAARARLDATVASIAALPPQQAAFANTVAAYEAALAEYAEAVEPMTVLADVSPDPEVREAAGAIGEEHARHKVEVAAHEGLYAAFTAAAAKGERLDPQDARLLERTLAEFRDLGHGMDAASKARLVAISGRLETLNKRFEENLREDRGELEATEAELAGVPADVLQAMPRTEDGRYRVSLDMATYMAVISSARDGGLRARLEKADQRRGIEQNPAILKEGLELRAEAARLKGYKSFGHMTLEDGMAGSPEKVAEFFGKLREVIGARAERDKAELLARKRLDDPSAERLESSDRFFYEETLKRERFGVDPDEVRSYFPLERVVDGALRTYARLLGLRFTPVADAPVWHAEVRVYDAYDAKTGALLGRFYLDLIAREGKYGFAAMQPLMPGRELGDGTYRAPASMVIANFPRPAPGQPTLLPHSDVETLFHELGHVMHELATQSRHATMAGSQVAMDFAELPSQIMENLAWHPEVLADISGRVSDGKPLPPELLERMVAARAFQRGLFYLRQLTYAMIDQAFHAAAPADPVAAANALIEAVMGFKVQDGAAPVASYEYLFGGYEAFYYGYAWSEAYAEDGWSRFAAEGLEAAGAAFRREVLAPGSSREEAESLAAFLGRAPSLDAFIRKLLEEPRTVRVWWKPWTWSA
jgi:thimet oligopeptidase